MIRIPQVGVVFVLGSAIASLAVAGPLPEGAAPHLVVNAVGVFSIDLGDQLYVGESNLNQPLSGVEPGLLVGIDVPIYRRVFIAVEFSAASTLSVDQAFARTGNRQHANLNNTIAGIMAGATTPLKTLEWRVGLGQDFIEYAVNGQPFLSTPSYRLCVFAGVDAAMDRDARLTVVGTIRFIAMAGLSTYERQNGMGGQIIRFGAGVRLRLTR